MTRSVVESAPPDLAFKRVLVIRLSAIGDVVFASPLIDAIKRARPDAEVYWLAESTVAPLLQHHAGLSELLIWPRDEWRELLRRGRLWRLSREVLSFRKRLRAHQFDLVLDVQGLLKSAVLAWMTGARTRVGFRSKEPTGWFLTERVPKNLEPTISSEYRGLAQYIGLKIDDFPMTVPLSEGARTFAERGHDGRPYVVFCPFTTRPQKHWPETHWRSLADTALAEGWRIVVLGAPADRPTAERIFAGQAVESKVGACSLEESAALVSQASLVVGVDTGLTHMGWAFSVPVVALFGSTCPYRIVPGREGDILYADLSCSPCRRRPTCGGAFDCMSALTPGAVINAAERYLSTESMTPPVLASSENREEGL
jgi:heptosyltransferase-1